MLSQHLPETSEGNKVELAFTTFNPIPTKVPTKPQKGP